MLIIYIILLPFDTVALDEDMRVIEKALPEARVYVSELSEISVILAFCPELKLETVFASTSMLLTTPFPEVVPLEFAEYQVKPPFHTDASLATRALSEESL